MVLNKLQPREKKLLIGFIAVLLIGGFSYFYSWQKKSLNQKELQIDNTLNKVKIESAKLKKSSVLEKKYQILLKKLNAKQKDFLEQNQEVDFLLDLNDLALNTNVSLTNMKPGHISQQDIYLEFPVDITLKGAYGNIIKFIEEVKSLKYITRINKFNISSVAGSNNELEAKISLRSYSLDRKEVN
ncbi:type IV pilus inner membrane component PilO [Orenia marismortui]|uniref:type 4a pilus biogenesis protein PilO n=1 Tax=Orenia marismortui TaxID=46469 RepID=UPI0003808898|nr:type 4a pilus biogenesis protein PilO [Orenia marismortui]